MSTLRPQAWYKVESIEVLVMKKVAVIGGGISGLAAAEYLRRGKARPVVFEQSARWGGAVRTVRSDGWLMEAGPDSLVAAKPAALELARELGLELIAASSQGMPSVVHRGRLLALPEGFRLIGPTRFWPFVLSPLLSWTGKLRAALELFVPVRPGEQDESVGHFISRRFGGELMETLAQPLIGGIYAADLHRLSLLATLPMFRALEKADGSVTAGLFKAMKNSSSAAAGAMFMTPREGMESLITALAEKLPSQDLRLQQSVLELRRHGERGWELQTTSDPELFDAVVLACSSKVASRLLAPFAPEAAQALAWTPHVSTATVQLRLEERQLGVSLKGSGFVVPHVEGLAITACTFAHKKYQGRAPKGGALLRVHLGNAMNQAVLEHDDERLAELAWRELRPLLKTSGSPQQAVITRHNETLPQYEVDHRCRVERAERALGAHRGLALAGNGLTGVGLADCVVRAKAAAQTVLENVYER